MSSSFLWAKCLVSHRYKTLFYNLKLTKSTRSTSISWTSILPAEKSSWSSSSTRPSEFHQRLLSSSPQKQAELLFSHVCFIPFFHFFKKHFSRQVQHDPMDLPRPGTRSWNYCSYDGRPEWQGLLHLVSSQLQPDPRNHRYPHDGCQRRSSCCWDQERSYASRFWTAQPWTVPRHEQAICSRAPSWYLPWTGTNFITFISFNTSLRNFSSSTSIFSDSIRVPCTTLKTDIRAKRTSTAVEVWTFSNFHSSLFFFSGPLNAEQCEIAPYCCWNPVQISDEQVSTLTNKEITKAANVPWCYYNVFFIFHDQYKLKVNNLL